jgi:hypothetical protein
LFLEPLNINVGFEVLTAMVMKSANFWDITPCSLLKVNRCFASIFRVEKYVVQETGDSRWR